jgi:hypothetical protein
MPDVKEKLLKDSHTRTVDDTRFVTKVVIDTRKDTHDLVSVFVRGTPVGQLVMEKAESLPMSRRILPDTLRYDQEPSEVMYDYDIVIGSYIEAVAEIEDAIRTNNTEGLKAFMVKIKGANKRDGNSHTRVLGIVRSGQARLTPEVAAAAASLFSNGNGS